MHLYIMRHGESYINLPDWVNDGEYDTALTARGHQQAAAAATWVREWLLPIDVIYSSTMRRARETADYVARALNQPIRFDDRIREIGNNYMDHRPVEPGTATAYADFWASQRPFSNITPAVEGGETMMHFRTRVGLFLTDLMERHREQTVLVVCHGFVIDMFLDLAYNVGAFRHCEVWSSNTGITHLQYGADPGREAWRLHTVNRIEHLAGIGGLGLSASSRPELWQQ